MTPAERSQIAYAATTSSAVRALVREHEAALVEIEKLRDEVAVMRPVFAAALVWRDGQHADGVRALIAAVDEADPREPADG